MSQNGIKDELENGRPSMLPSINEAQPANWPLFFMSSTDLEILCALKTSTVCITVDAWRGLDL